MIRRAALVVITCASCVGRSWMEAPTVDLCIGVVCDDGNPCNGEETCEPAVGCVAGTPLPGGTLDPSFADGGSVLVDLSGGGVDQAKRIALTSDGQIRVGAQSRGVTNNDYSAVAFSSDGSLDASFDLDGMHRLDSGDGNDTQRAMAIGPNGEWLLAGSSVVAGNVEGSMFLLSSNGSRESYFGANGLSLITGADDDEINDAVWLADDTMYVTGRINDSGAGFPSDGFVARVLRSGSVDPTFGTGGIAIVPIGGRPRMWAVTVDGERIYVGGHAWTGSNNDIVVAALDTSGSPDPTFGTDGVVVFNVGGDAQLRGLRIDSDGRVLCSGYSGNAPLRDFFVARLTADGILDDTFGTAGYTPIAVTPTTDNASRLVIDGDGRLLVVGEGDYEGAAPESVMARLTEDGSLDPTFGVDGVARWSFAEGATPEVLRDLVLDPAGRILAAGWAHNGTDLDILTVRVCP